MWGASSVGFMVPGRRGGLVLSKPYLTGASVHIRNACCPSNSVLAASSHCGTACLSAPAAGRGPVRTAPAALAGAVRNNTGGVDPFERSATSPHPNSGIGFRALAAPPYCGLMQSRFFSSGMRNTKAGNLHFGGPSITLISTSSLRVLCFSSLSSLLLQ